MVLKYEAFLQEETKARREFIEGMNKEVAVAIAIIIAVAGFFGFRS